MKKYILFAGDQYYPYGGFEDYRGSADSIDELKQLAQSFEAGWAQIVDLENRQVVLIAVNNDFDKINSEDWEAERLSFAKYSAHQPDE